MYRRLLIVIELDKNVNMYSIICDLMWLHTRDIEGSLNRVYFVGFDLDGKGWKEVYVLYIYLLINLRIYKDL